MACLRLFGPARETAGVGSLIVSGDTVAAIAEEAKERFGQPFSLVLESSRFWVNGDQVEIDAPVGEGDEVAVIPPVSGG